MEPRVSEVEALDPEDAKLVTLARSARARIGSSTGAAVRDDTGRTYAAADVPLASLPVSALDMAVAQAWISGARGLEAAAVVLGDPTAPVDTTVVAEAAGSAVPIYVCGADGSLLRQQRT